MDETADRIRATNVFERPLSGSVMSNADPETDLVNAYIAGVFDAEHAVRCTVLKEKTNRAGYRIVPTIELRSKHQMVVNVVQNWMNDIGVFATMERRGEASPSYQLKLRSRDDVRTVLERISPYLIVQDRDAEIMLEEIIPRLDDDRVLTEERFIEIMEYVEQLSDTGANRTRKYDLAFFREEFGIEAVSPDE